MIPNVITHNFDPALGAARNICSLPIEEAERVLDGIRASGTRQIKANYLRRRIAVEDWLISERYKKLGDTPLSRPIYFFLGDFANGKDPSRPSSLVMPLDAFSPEVLTFTYPDSMASLPMALRKEHAPQRKEYHGVVFTLQEIERVVAKFGFPISDRKYDRFIEVQVWDDAPIRKYMSKELTSAGQ